MAPPPEERQRGTYVGEFDAEGRKSGRGTVTWPDGAKFDGRFEANAQVEGTMTFADGTTYEGPWRDAKPHGSGRIAYLSGATYEGGVEAGRKHGTGTFTASDGSTYRGSFDRDRVQGEGEMRYADGRVYHGSWRDGARHGVGSCAYPNGSRYEGSWVSDRREGDGSIKHADGSSYAGRWKANVPHGPGVYVFANGDKFEGEWKDGRKVGEGRYSFCGSATKRPVSSSSKRGLPPPAAAAGAAASTAAGLPPPPPPKTTEKTVYAVISGGPAKVCGAYVALSKRGSRGEVTYHNKLKRTYLYHIDAQGHYCVGRTKAGAACLCFNKHATLQASGTWMAYEEGAWRPAPTMVVRITTERPKAAVDGSAAKESGDDDDSSMTTQLPGGGHAVARAVAVTSRFANIDGGYALASPARALSSRGVYHNEEDAKELWYYDATRTWLVSDAAGVGADGSYSSYAASEPTDAVSPEDADWRRAGIAVRVVPPPEAAAQLLKAAQGGGDDDPDASSLYSDPDFRAGSADALGTLPNKTKGAEPVVWVRPTRLQPPGDPVMLFNGIEPNDVAQGALGDCWLLTAVAAVAEFPAFIEEHVFVTKELDATGRYQLNIYDAARRRFRVVTIDDAIPCSAGSWWDAPRPLFAQPAHNELYILLIEKCFAKLAGSYERLAGGYPLLAWCALTGCEDLQSWKRPKDGDADVWRKSVVALDRLREQPFDFQRMYTVSTDDAADADAMFDWLATCDARNYIMAASISGATIEKPRDDGLVERHAYAVIAAKRTSTGHRLVQARNPWGNDREWNGPFSDGADEWTTTFPALAAELDYEPKDDGLFWMAWEDFHRIFDSIQICAIEMPTKRGQLLRG